jgi:hypothetical protein
VCLDEQVGQTLGVTISGVSSSCVYCIMGKGIVGRIHATQLPSPSPDDEQTGLAERYQKGAKIQTKVLALARLPRQPKAKGEKTAAEKSVQW